MHICCVRPSVRLSVRRIETSSVGLQRLKNLEVDSKHHLNSYFTCVALRSSSEDDFFEFNLPSSRLKLSLEVLAPIK